MKYLMDLETKRYAWFFCFLLLFSCLARPAGAVDGEATQAGAPAKEALRLGEAMYLKGDLPSGQPLKGMVQGNLELLGKMAACTNCHRRSGLGGLEGGVFTPPTNGARLYLPVRGVVDLPGSLMKRAEYKNSRRPAYTDALLAVALRDGIGSGGRVLSDTMPRYLLDDEAMKIMILYLKNLTAKHSPGATKDEIRFATVVSEGVSPAEREAMLLPLQSYINVEWNGRYGSARVADYAKLTTGAKTYSKAVLDVWELKGPQATWGDQLAAFYRQNPVFAVLGGIVPGKWAPVHQFCEQNKIPCLFPLTDLPVVSETDWYTLYFSKGFYQEGEAAAKYLSRVFDLAPDRQVIQVFRDGDAGEALARGFADTWKKLGNSSLENRSLAAAEQSGPHFWKGLAATHPGAVMLVWLAPADLAGIESLTAPGKPATLFVSATMLGGALGSIPDSIRQSTFLTYPTRLPGDAYYTGSAVSNWLEKNKIPLTNLTISSNTYFSTRLLSNALREMGDDLYREFFLELLEDGNDEIKSSATYPELSFGQGERYAAKGCYVVTLTSGKNPKVVRRSDWVIY